jgi:predicted Zn-dependent protease
MDEAAAVTAGVPENSLTNDYALAAIPARYALERGRWSEAAVLPIRPAPAWRATEGITRFARAVGAARSGNVAVARAEVDSLAALENLLKAAGGPQAYWATQVGIQRMAAEAWAAFAAGDTARALAEARDAADLDDHTEKHPVTPGPVLPPRELYGEMLLEAGRPAEAGQAFEAALARQPNRARSLEGLQKSRRAEEQKSR